MGKLGKGQRLQWEWVGGLLPPSGATTIITDVIETFQMA